MENFRKTVEEMVAGQTVCFLSTIDAEGYPNTRAMLAPVRRQGIETLWWHTNSLSMKVGQLRANPRACVYFCDQPSFRGVMLKGKMEVVDDEKTKHEFWQDEYSVYYKGGAQGGDFILLKFTAESARWYSNFNQKSFLIDQTDHVMEEKICQSCGMNMRTAEELGTNADGTKNSEYCHYCYQKGAFTRDVTMDEMLETNLQFLDHWNEETGNNFTPDQARPILRGFLATLKRWKKG